MNCETKHPLTQEALSQFTGDLDRYRHSLNRSAIFTPGVKFMADSGGAYWLVDAIASYLRPAYLKPLIERDPRIGELHFWKLTVAADRTAALEARADSGEEPFIRQAIEYTDFPLASVDIWAAYDGTHWTLYLPSEH